MSFTDILYTIRYWIKPPKIKRFGERGFERFYGRVNAWGADLTKLRKELRVCAKHGVGYHIELLGWARYGVAGGATKEGIEKAYKTLVKWAKIYGVPVFVSIANDNSGSGKYGEKGPHLDKQKEILEWALQLVVKHGNKAVVLVQPVAEIQTSFGKSWDAHANSTLLSAGFSTCYNGDFGRPGGTAGHSVLAWHPQKTSASVPKGAMCVSDCGSIILQLNAGLDGKGHPDKIRDYTKKCQDMGCLGYAHYAFLYNGPVDEPAIKAVAGK